MKLKKILIISGAVLVAAGIAGFTIVRAQSGLRRGSLRTDRSQQDQKHPQQLHYQDPESGFRSFPR